MRITVEDTGIGIPEDKLPQNLLSVRARRRVNLAGVWWNRIQTDDQSARAAHGRPYRRPERGDADAVGVTLALGVNREAPAPPSSEWIDLARVRTLIADDNAISQRVLFEQVSSLGLRGAIVSSGYEAVTVLRGGQEEGDPFKLTLVTQHTAMADGGKLVDDEFGLRNPRNRVRAADARGSARRRHAHGGPGLRSYLSGPLRQVTSATRSRVCGRRTRAVNGSVIIPARANAETREPHKAQPSIRERFIHAKILVAEDNPVNQEVAIEILKYLGCNVDIAGTGEEAVAMAQFL